jgi:hypothetical protein
MVATNFGRSTVLEANLWNFDSVKRNVASLFVADSAEHFYLGLELYSFWEVTWWRQQNSARYALV